MDIKNIKRMWSRFPDKKSVAIPQYYGSSPRLDAVRAIGEHCATQELKLYNKKDLRKNGKNAEPINEHPLYELLDNPVPEFPEIDGWALRYFTFVQLELVGECAWLKVRNGNKIVALLPIPKSWIHEKPTQTNHTYVIQPYGEMNGTTLLRVPTSDIVFFKDIDVTDPYGNGKGLAESIADEIETDEYASKYQKNFFYNDATPPFVITGFQGNEQQAEKVKQTFLEKISGFHNARKPAVLTGGADVKTLGIAPKELDMVESRRYLRDECLHHFRLPPEIMGIIENSNRATIDASFYLMQKNVLPSRLVRFERALNRQLMSDFDSDLVCKHDFEADEDLEMKFRVYSFGLQNSVITAEEFRAQFGLAADIPEGTLLKPQTQEEVNIDEIEDPEQVTIDDEEEQQDGQEEENEEQDPIDLDDEDKKKGLKIMPQKDENSAIKIKAWEMFDKGATSKEGDFTKAVNKIATKQLEEITKLLNDYDGKPVENIINDYYSKEVDNKTKSTLAPQWLACMQTGRQNARTLLGKKAVEDVTDTYLTNAEFNKWVEIYGLEKSVMINDTTKKELIKKLKEILAGDDVLEIPMNELKKRLIDGAKEVYQELKSSRAMMIARTETGATVNYGQMATYKANGMQQKQWLATYDNRTRNSHLYVSEQIIGIDELFDVGGSKMLYPLDPNGSADEVINCRCSILSLE